LIWTEIVFLTGQVIFVPEWPKGEFVSFCVGCILLDNHFYVMLLLSQGSCFLQSPHFSYKLQEDSVQNSNQPVQFPCIRSDDVVFRPDALQSATDVKIFITRKCTNRLQLMDCKCEVDPTGNCVFANKI
jgi:hypothetical protein